MLEAAGAKDVHTYGEYSAPGFCIHEIGTARMGQRLIPRIRPFDLLRNTPLTLIILFCGLGLGSIITVADVQTTNYFWLAVIGLVAYTSAFVCEVLRSGVNTVPFGQAEAARSIGLSFTQTLRIVVLPQAFRAVIAPLGSVLIALIKNTTIAAAIGVPEAFYTMRNQLQNHGDIVIPIFVGYALFFVVLTLPVGLFFGWLAKRWAVAR